MEEKEIILKKVEMSLDTMRSYLREDGGDIDIIALDDDMELFLQFKGSCSSCHQIKMTSAGIEEAIKNYIPQIKKIHFNTI